ncbi:secondary thiamine-phosphate synthase enzyme YjbQ [Chloroflexota bacterium]
MVINRKIGIETKGDCDIIDITTQVAGEISDSGIDSGTATIFISGSTAGISTVEYEIGLISDLKEMWKRIVPSNMSYQHDKRWGDGNGHSHVRASLLGPSLTIPFVRKKMALGTWQQIIVIDFDNRPRSREIVIQLLGE